VLLTDAVPAYLADRLARGELRPNSVHQVRWRLSVLVKACPPGLHLADLDRYHVAAWQAAMVEQRPATRRAGVSAVRTFCRWAQAEGLLEGDPTARVGRVVEPRRDTRALSAGKVARLQLVLPDLRAQVIVALMFGVGLRCCEVARLHVDDYDGDPDGPQVRVVGKGDHERRVPVPLAVAAVLDDWLADRGRGPLVGLSAARLSVLVSGWMDQAGLKRRAYDGVSAHALRHTFASDVLDRCGNVRVAQALLGHQSLATTQRYLRVASMDQMRAAADPDWPPAA
jgi:integrase/recombinase XerC